MEVFDKFEGFFEVLLLLLLVVFIVTLLISVFTVGNFSICDLHSSI